MKKQTESQVIQFLRLAWKNSDAGVPFAWERLNHTMAAAMRVALGAFKFEPGDYATAMKEFNGGRWCDPEGSYATAVANGNTSACVSIEKYLGREPIIADDVKMAGRYDSNTHLIADRQKERLHVGAGFTWKGDRVKITSFSGNAAIACSYRKVGEEESCDKCGHSRSWPREKVAKRYTITREAIIAERAERKRKSEIWERLVDLKAGELVRTELGSTNRDVFDRQPLKKLEKILAKAEKTAEVSA